MKRTMLLLTLLFTASAANANQPQINLGDLLLPGMDRPNPELVPVREDPGPNAERKTELIHSKTVSLEVTGYKETTLGYGAVTSKILVPALASHTVFNHRNDGEDAPCLAGRTLLGERAPRTPAMADVTIQMSNEYRINRDRKICQVTMVEFVTTTLEGKTYTHRKRQDMGFRYIGDCPQ